MVRPASLLHPQRPPVTPRAAATMLFVRDAAGSGIEILMTRRSATASFSPGAHVFPGGTVDVADGSALAHRLADRRQSQSDDQVRFAVTAIREAWEELGVLLARPAGQSGQPPGPLPALPAAALSLPRDADAEGFLAAVDGAGMRLAVDSVWFYCHWITDRDLPRRFDTRFLVAAMPPAQDATPDNREQFEPVWITPAAALERHEAGRFEMIFPTIRTLRRMTRYRDVAGLIADCRGGRPLFVSSPRAGLVGDRVERFMEDESPFGELELTSPDGQIVHRLDWRRTEAAPLLRHVIRLTAPNPGVMTGPGTNTYLIGTPAHGYIVIDPGPALDEHIDRIHALVGKDLRQILCTHSHPDHSPGAARLQQLTGAPIAGLSSRPTANAHSQFRPDAEIEDGEHFTLSAAAPASDGPVSAGPVTDGPVTNRPVNLDTNADDRDPGLATITLRAVLTPGHAANHVCFFLEEDRLLFSGDHILNGSTTIVNPPDGNMVAYLDSLQRLAGLDAAFILPAHGHVLGSPAQAIAHLLNHRLKREARVLAAIEARPGAGLAALVELAYADAPVAAHGIAQRSLLAHAEKLVADGCVIPSGDGWRVNEVPVD